MTVANTQKRGNGHFSLADYKAKVKGEPYTLDVTETESITIERPTGDQILDAEEAMREGNSRKVIATICGDAADDVMAVLGPLDAAILQAVTEDLQKHFGLGE